MVSGISHRTKNRCLRAIDAIGTIPYYSYTPVDCLKSFDIYSNYDPREGKTSPKPTTVYDACAKMAV
jgi:hypothetical protein